MKYFLIIFLGATMMITSCKEKNNEEIIGMDNIYAWCIVPFDSLERSPEERISMLKKLGINKYAYDWREEHLSEMAKELRLAKKNNIDVIAVWMFIDNNGDSINGLSNSNDKVFNIIKEVDYKGQIWLGFNANFFENLSDSEAVKKGTEMIAFLSKKASALGCKIALYNHGNWFGEPKNQIKMIENLPNEDLGVIYNFHHAHKQIDAFPENVTLMMPYLWNVNLNGLRKEGPKILTIGQGDHEKDMIDLLLKKGYKGGFGILGHVKDADVEIILKANLIGLKN
jgi:sugar phosphate isomerase/epimerase